MGASKYWRACPTINPVCRLDAQHRGLLAASNNLFYTTTSTQPLLLHPCCYYTLHGKYNTLITRARASRLSPRSRWWPARGEYRLKNKRGKSGSVG